MPRRQASENRNFPLRERENLFCLSLCILGIIPFSDISDSMMRYLLCNYADLEPERVAYLSNIARYITLFSLLGFPFFIYKILFGNEDIQQNNVPQNDNLGNFATPQNATRQTSTRSTTETSAGLFFNRSTSNSTDNSSGDEQPDEKNILALKKKK